MTRSPFPTRLFQEDLRHEPFWMLVACSLVNLTTWRKARHVFKLLRALYPAPGDLAKADDVLVELLRPLGLSNRRSQSLRALDRVFHESAPKVAADVLRLPGCGQYAADSWAIFIEGRSDVDPSDGKLAWYLETRRQSSGLLRRERAAGLRRGRAPGRTGRPA